MNSPAMAAPAGVADAAGRGKLGAGLRGGGRRRGSTESGGIHGAVAKNEEVVCTREWMVGGGVVRGGGPGRREWMEAAGGWGCGWGDADPGSGGQEPLEGGEAWVLRLLVVDAGVEAGHGAGAGAVAAAWWEPAVRQRGKDGGGESVRRSGQREGKDGCGGDGDKGAAAAIGSRG